MLLFKSRKQTDTYSIILKEIRNEEIVTLKAELNQI